MLWFCSFPSKKSCGLASWFRTFRRAPKTKKRERIRTGWGVQKCENLSKSFAKKFFPVAGTVLRIITQCLFPYFVFLKHFLTDYASLFEGHLVRVVKKIIPFFFLSFFFFYHCFSSSLRAKSTFQMLKSTFSTVSDCENHVSGFFAMRKARFRLFRNAKSTFQVFSQCEMHFCYCFTVRNSLFRLFHNAKSTFHNAKSIFSKILQREEHFFDYFLMRKVI